MHSRRTKRPRTHLFVLAAALSLTTLNIASARSITYVRIDKSAVNKYLNPIPARADRVRTLRRRFKRAGCSGEDLVEQRIPGEDLPNVICVLPGTNKQSIVIGAPLDYNSQGDEDKVDWATLTILPLLAESLNSAPHRHDCFDCIHRAPQTGWFHSVRETAP